MPSKIILDNAVVEDDWQLIDAAEDTLPEGKIIVPLKVWNEQLSELSARPQIGLWLNSDESPQDIQGDLHQLDVIAVNFPAFADGRGFSYGRELRETHRYQGQLRAIGGFIRDQLFYLKRCGFNAFALDATDLEAALSSFQDFSETYQAAIDQPTPLFRRR